VKQLLRVLVLLCPMAGLAKVAQAGSPMPYPCTDAATACIESINVVGQAKRLMVYRTYGLLRRNTAVTRAFILVHGILRDADNHFRTAVAGGFLAGRLADTIIVAPRFASNSNVPGNEAGGCRDSLAADEANWICDPQRPDTWRSGGPEVGSDTATSFDFLDTLVARLADRSLFPNIKAIVVAGHSAGGRLVVRYAMASTKAVPAGIALSYIVANPSSYAYLDEVRPAARIASAPTVSVGPMPAPAAQAQVSKDDFGPFADAGNCTRYNDWPYGLEHRLGYAALIDADQLVQQFTHRSVTYLLGDADVFASGVFDASCPAMAQGTSRLGRGLAFSRYMHDRFSAPHTTIVVPYCSHSARCMFTADVSLPAMFPR
jgi:pimeloyl-ACP methyl ester carboxylesterase